MLSFYNQQKGVCVAKHHMLFCHKLTLGDIQTKRTWSIPWCW